MSPQICLPNSIGGTHDEIAGWNGDHFGALRAIAEDSAELAGRNLLAPRAPALAVKNFADGVDHRLWLIELDIFRAIAGGDLFSVRRQSEPASLRKARLLLVFDPLRRLRGLCLQMAYSMI